MRGAGELRATVGLHKPRGALRQSQHERTKQMLFMLLPNYAFLLLDLFFLSPTARFSP